MSDFANEVLARSLAELRGRRAKLEQFITEAGELDLAIREMERVCKKVGVTVGARPRAVEARPAASQEGTNADRALKVLRDHPRGLNTTVISREANIAQGSISVALNDLTARGVIEKVGRGFYRMPNADAATG